MHHRVGPTFDNTGAEMLGYEKDLLQKCIDEFGEAGGRPGGVPPKPGRDSGAHFTTSRRVSPAHTAREPDRDIERRARVYLAWRGAATIDSMGDEMDTKWKFGWNGWSG